MRRWSIVWSQSMGIIVSLSYEAVMWYCQHMILSPMMRERVSCRCCILIYESLLAWLSDRCRAITQTRWAYPKLFSWRIKWSDRIPSRGRGGGDLVAWWCETDPYRRSFLWWDSYHLCDTSERCSSERGVDCGDSQWVIAREDKWTICIERRSIIE